MSISPQLIAGSLVNDSTAIHDDNAIRQPECYFTALLGQQNRKTVLSQSLIGFNQLINYDRRETL